MERTRRDVLAGIGTTTVAGFAGCATLTGSTCEQGPTAIEDLTDGSGNEVTLQGEVVETDPGDVNTFTINDGSGRARGATRRLPDIGDCVRMSGEVSHCVCPDNEYYIDPMGWDQA